MEEIQRTQCGTTCASKRGEGRKGERERGREGGRRDLSSWEEDVKRNRNERAKEGMSFIHEDSRQEGGRSGGYRLKQISPPPLIQSGLKRCTSIL